MSEDKFSFWQDTLKGARLVVAPMVDASELAWRMLSRRYGAELCYTPMLHSGVLIKDHRYRKDTLQSCDEDRPLIVQLCGNDPQVVGEACVLASPHCDAIDINLGCPQAIAKRGKYGAFLMDDLDLVKRIVESAVQHATVPITCKIRIFKDRQKTVQYAQMLEKAGASLLTVHGRTRDQKGPLTGLADWSYIKEVRESVSVPVFSNGNIQYLSDAIRCMAETGVQGVMTAESNLHNPALFTEPSQFPEGAPRVWQMALEYLNLAKTYPCPISYSRGHLFKLLHFCFSMCGNSDIRQIVSRAKTLDTMIEAVEMLRDRMAPYADGEKEYVPENDTLAALPFKPWVCQPYVRLSPEEHLQKFKLIEERKKQKELEELNGTKDEQKDDTNRGSLKRPLSDEKEADLLIQNHLQLSHLSKKKAKKLLRNPWKQIERGEIQDLKLCVCRSPRGGKCEFQMCKVCCKSKCYRENLDCSGHRIWVKTNRNKARTLPPKEITNLPAETEEMVETDR